MAVPCITDTCSITGTIDENRRLSLRARLDPAGGLVCGTDANPDAGLRVAIYEDPGTAGALVDECLNGLRRTAAGELLSVSPRAGIKSVTGATVDMPLTGDESAESFDFTAENPYDCTVTGIVFGRMELTYGIPAAAPFNADIRTRVLLNGTGKAAVFMDVGGDTSSLGLANTVKRRYAYFIETFSAFGGATTTWTATANHEGSTEDNNILTSGSLAGADLGYRALVNVLYLPFNIAAVA